MRVRIRRRSVSSFVSPGPRVPMPPPRRDSAVPGADQPRQQVLQLRELDLQLAFARPRAAREDVEDELRAVDDLPADLLFDVPQLRRRELVVEDDDDRRRSPRTTPRACWILPGAEKRGRIGLRPLLQHAQHDLGAGRLGQARELVERSLGLETALAARRSGRPAPLARDGLASTGRASSHACISSHGIAPARTRRGARTSVTSTIVDGAPPGVAPGVEEQVDPIAERRARPRPDRPSPAAPLRFALVAVIGRARGAADGARHRVGRHADADATCPAVTPGGERRGRGDQQRQRPRPEAIRQSRRDRRQRTEVRRDLLGVGRDERHARARPRGP